MPPRCGREARVYKTSVVFILSSTYRQRIDSLIPRGHPVLELVVSGMLNKQVAGELGAAEKTITIHRGRIMAKMHAKSMVDLARMTGKIGIGRRRRSPDEPRGWGRSGRHRTKDPYTPVGQPI